MSDHDLDAVILACHAARMQFVGQFMRIIGVREIIDVDFCAGDFVAVFS